MSFRPAVVSILFVSACSTFQEPTFNRRMGANGEATLIVPFRESPQERWYGESRRGRFIADAAKAWSRENGDDVDILPDGEDVNQVLSIVTDRTDKEISAKEWRELVKSLGVRYVVEGDLTQFDLRQRRMVGLYDARASARFRVIDAAQGKVALEDEIKANVGVSETGADAFLFDAPAGETDAGLEERLLTQLGEELGKKLYGYYPE